MGTSSWADLAAKSIADRDYSLLREIAVVLEARRSREWVSAEREKPEPNVRVECWARVATAEGVLNSVVGVWLPVKEWGRWMMDGGEAVEVLFWRPLGDAPTPTEGATDRVMREVQEWWRKGWPKDTVSVRASRLVDAAVDVVNWPTNEERIVDVAVGVLCLADLAGVDLIEALARRVSGYRQIDAKLDGGVLQTPR